MTEVANDRIAQRAEEAHKKVVAEGVEAARAWLADGPVKVGGRIRLTRADRDALIGLEQGYVR